MTERKLQARFLEKCALGILCTLCMGTSPVFNSKPPSPTSIILPVENALPSDSPNAPMSDELWQYLRAGLNYLETSGKNYPPNYRHPGNIAYGPLGLTEGAVADVMQRNKVLAHLDKKEVFQQPHLYEMVARHYADLLLRHYLNIDYSSKPAPEVFVCLQKAWFLGPTAYKRGEDVIASRERKTRVFIARIGFPAPIPGQPLISQLP